MNTCRRPGRRAHLARRWNQPTRSDRGDTTVELVIVIPVLFLLLLFVVYAGRLTQANTRVHHAAAQAARAASLRSQAHGPATAQTAAARALADGGLSCTSSSVSTSWNAQISPGTVSVTVTCAIDRSDLAPLAPGLQTLTATSTEVIDLRRADERGDVP